MTLHQGDFGTFFAEINEGHPPFAWQRRLFDNLAVSGRWPDQIGAPTGAGKSSVVEIHLFAVALFAAGAIAAIPRRLALVVNRRALVDNQADRALEFRDKLHAAPPESLLGEIAAALRSLRAQPPGDNPRPVFDIVDLRGGVPPRRDWVTDPSACQIICATPDMWGSRVLFRGYGASPLARPREAGLLSLDAAMVLDEAHLNRQLLLTAWRVAQLGQQGAEAIGVPGLQVVATTATPADGAPSGKGLIEIAVEQPDLAEGGDDALRRRLTTPKPIQPLAEESWPPVRAGAQRNHYLDALIEETLRLHQQFGSTVGCFVNTVGLAAEATIGLRRAGLTVELLVGRMRPFDRLALQTRRPGLLTVRGNPEVDVLVATQTLEVGVDVDLSALVTELAPASALAQRAGRVNRLGLREKTQVSVIGPAAQSVLLTPEPDARQLGSFTVAPYMAKGDIESCRHLAQTWEWLTGRAGDPNGLSPWSLHANPPPAEPMPRVLLQRLEPYDVWYLSRTSADLFDEPDLELWLRDSLDPDQLMCGVVVRAHLPGDDSAAVGLLNATPPTDGEIYPASLGETRSLLTTILAAEEDAVDARAFVYRNNDVAPLAAARDIKTGDVVIIDARHDICVEGVVTAEPSQPGSDVYEEATWQDDSQRVLRFIATRSDWEAQLLEELADMRASSAEDVDGRLVTELIRAYRGHDPRIATLPADPDRSPDAISITYGGLDDPTSRWLVVAVIPAGEVGEALRQVWTPSPAPVLLDGHNSAVGHRAGELAARVGLPPALQEVLVKAGHHHDAGKSDCRFQQFTLGNPDHATTLLAKSHNQTVRQLRGPAVGALPTRWRHEQLSAALTAVEIDRTPHGDLVLRLVGTSHGHGRPGFPHTAAALLAPDTEEQVTQWARKLFDTGHWDDLIETTHQQWGVWACAYLEALLRGADAQVSGEGR